MSSSSSRCRQWRIHLGVVFVEGNGEVTSSQEEACLQQHRARYQQLVEQHPYPVEEDDEPAAEESSPEETNDNPSSEAAASLDPLTAMMREAESQQEAAEKMDLHYRKERAKRNRGVAVQRVVESEEYDETAVTLQIIDKDLQRLPPAQMADASRIAVLRQVLFVHHVTTTPTPGYRQGMHEIASHLLWALEQEEQGSTAGAEASLAADSFALLSRILEPLQPAFDTGTTDKQPLVALGRRILQVTAQYHPALMQCLQQKVQVPPQLYLTKWIRLLYSRELEQENGVSLLLLGFWDFLFETTASCKTFNLLTVLEAAAAARLLLHAPAILQSDDPLHYLMNVPLQPAASLAAWQTTTLEILQGPSVPLTQVVLTVPPPAAAPQQQDPTPQQKEPPPPSTLTDALWNHPLSALTSSSASVRAVVAPNQAGTDAAASSRPLLSSLSASLKSTYEQAKTKTQATYEHAKTKTQQALSQSLQQPQPQAAAQPPQSSPYNLFYRPNGTATDLPLYDPPVGGRPAPPTAAVDDEWRRAFELKATVVQSYLWHLEQEQGIVVPREVMQNMAELRDMANGPK